MNTKRSEADTRANFIDPQLKNSDWNSENYGKYSAEELQRNKLTDLVKLKLGTPKDAKEVFGNMNNLLNAYYQLQKEIYKAG